MSWRGLFREQIKTFSNKQLTSPTNHRASPINSTKNQKNHVM